MGEWELPKDVETQSIERVGGGVAWESGVYDATVKMVYLMGLVGKSGKVAVHQVIEDRTTPNAKGVYIPTGEVRTVNQCKFFGNTAGKTAEEITKNEAATMFNKWASKNTGAVINQSTSASSQGNNSAASIMSSAPTEEAAAGSLFDKEPPI